MLCDLTGSLPSAVRRNRALPGGASPYHVSPDSVTVSGAEVTARLQDSAAAAPVPLRLTLTVLPDSTVRLRVTEETPLRARYTPQYALEREPEPEPAGLTVVSQTTERLHVKFGADSQLVISNQPFTLELAKGENTVITVNTDGLFNFEHYRVKPQP